MNDIHPIKPPLGISLFDTPFLFWFILIVITICWGYYFYHQMITRKEEVKVETDDITTNFRDRFLKQMRALNSLLDKEQYEELFEQISVINKEFFKTIMDIDVSDMTTAEIKKVKQTKALHEILTCCDRIKFSKQSSDIKSESKNMIEQSQIFIREFDKQ